MSLAIRTSKDTNNKSHPSISFEYLLQEYYSVILEAVPPLEESIVMRMFFLLRTSLSETISSVMSKAAIVTNSINFAYIYGVIYASRLSHVSHVTTTSTPA